jgi:hypothetical protein
VGKLLVVVTELRGGRPERGTTPRSDEIDVILGTAVCVSRGRRDTRAAQLLHQEEISRVHCS